LGEKIKKIVLAYSGGLDTSVILLWLMEHYQCPVIAFSADLGQGDDMDAVKEKAIQTGAEEVIVEDLKEEFVRDFVWPALRGNAIYESGYLLGTSLARPLIAMRQVEAARGSGANAVSHGATGKGNDQVRFEMAYMALEPGLKIIAPWRIWELKGREDLVSYALSKNIPIPVTKENPYSTDANLLHISFEAGILEDTWKEPPEDMFVMSVSPEDAPDQATYMEVGREEWHWPSGPGRESICGDEVKRRVRNARWDDSKGSSPGHGVHNHGPGSYAHQGRPCAPLRRDDLLWVLVFS
jgi:argininosuccinate synthase